MQDLTYNLRKWIWFTFLNIRIYLSKMYTHVKSIWTITLSKMFVATLRFDIKKEGGGAQNSSRVKIHLLHSMPSGGASCGDAWAGRRVNPWILISYRGLFIWSLQQQQMTPPPLPIFGTMHLMKLFLQKMSFVKLIIIYINKSLCMYLLLEHIYNYTYCWLKNQWID